MLRGHVFSEQTFAHQAFALFMDTFLQGNMGVIRGCSITNTNTTVTVGEGYFMVKGRPLEILGNETRTPQDNGYYSLVCEIDLTQENTETEFNQGSIKLLSNSSTYPTLIQQDINYDGTMYQYEFARFRLENGGITNFVDRRTFLNLESIYSKINEDASVVLEQIEQALDDVLDESIYALKTQLVDYQLRDELGNIVTRNYSIGTAAPTGGSNGDIYDQYFN